MKKRWDKTKPEFPYMNVLTGRRLTLKEAVQTPWEATYNNLMSHYINTMTGEPITFEDFVTHLCTEFVKETEKMPVDPLDYIWDKKGKYRKPYLKMNYAQRRKISEKIIKSLSI